MALEAVGDENRPKFFNAYFIPLKLTNLWIFLHNFGQKFMFKKKQAKKLIFDPKIALRTKRSDPARNHQFCADFLNVRLQCS